MADTRDTLRALGASLGSTQNFVGLYSEGNTLENRLAASPFGRVGSTQLTILDTRSIGTVLSTNMASNAPLASLTTRSQSLGTLQYPSDFSKNSHYIAFYIYLPTNQLTPEPSPTPPADVPAPGTLTAPNTQQRSSVAGFSVSPDQKRIDTAITLYMPDTIATNYTTAYQEDNLSDNALGQLGASAKSIKDGLDSGFGLRNLGEVGLVYSKALSGLFGKTNKSGKSSTLGKLFGSVLGAVPVDTILKGQGAAINPQVQLLFKGVGLREFQFEFMFSPKNASESKSIVDIVRTFQTYSAPTLQGENNSSAVGTLFFGLPATFQIQMVYNQQENPFMQKFGESVIENVSVDYAPNGFATFNDGSPVQIRLTLQFKETNILTRETIQQSYDYTSSVQG